MSNSYMMATVVLLLIGFTSISSVAGLKCYSCHNEEIGERSCRNSTTTEFDCLPEYNTCFEETYLEDGPDHKKGGVHYRYCGEETTESCTDTADHNKNVTRCTCKGDLCNGGNGTESGPQLSSGTDTNSQQSSTEPVRDSSHQQSSTEAGTSDQQSSPGTESNGHKPSASPSGAGGTQSAGHHHHECLLLIAAVFTAVLIFLQ